MKEIVVLFLLSANSALSANILYISGVPSPSHHIWNRALAFGLANKGYNVTLVGPDQDKVNPVNYSHIYLEGLYETFHENNDMLAMAELTQSQLITEFTTFCLQICEATIKSQGLKQLLSYPKTVKFDVIVMDVSMGSCLYPLFERFGYPPVVAVTPFLLPSYIAYNFGNHLFPTYVPWYGLPSTNKMSFKERFWNTVYMYGEVFYRNLLYYKEEENVSRKVFGNKFSSMAELERHISLVLTNSDPILDYPQPLAPNFIQVGGLHTRKPKEIPQEFRKILDDAKNGVIVFSLGSNVRSDQLNAKTRKSLLDAFSKLSETVIWKFESDIDNLPKNVIVSKWLPQNDILAHPNVKVFIGHGGALSTQESIFHGVPIICVPFFFDQHVISRNIVGRKLGISLDFRKITEEYFSAKIREVLDNPIYSENMKRTSRIFRDRLETPLERGMFWIEYVMRHKGAQFLNTPARDLPFYKSSGLDVIGVLLVISAIILVVFCKLIGLICSLCNSSKKLKTN